MRRVAAVRRRGHERPAEEQLDRAFLIIAGTIVVGAIAAVLDTTIVSVALAALARDFQADVATIQWVTTAYLLALAVVMPLSAWTMRRLGTRRVWLLSMGLFVSGSALCGLAWSAQSLIAFRVLQGLGGGMLLPAAQTIVAQAAGPRRLGRAMALLGIPIQLGPVLGPVMGGVLITSLSWRWAFYVNVPVCVLGLLVARRTLHGAPGAPDGRLDVTGFALLSPGLALLVYGFAEVGDAHGFGSPRVLIPMVAGVLLLLAFAGHALRTRVEPLLDLRLFKAPAFAGSAALRFTGGVSVCGSMLLLPLFEQTVRGRSALDAGLMLAPQGLGTVVGLIVCGRLADAFAPRRIVLWGLAVATGGTLPYALVSTGTPDLLLAVAQVVRGAGLAAAILPVMSAGLTQLRPDQIPGAVTTTRIFQQIGGSVGTAVLAVILQRQIRSAHTTDELAQGFGTTFTWAMALTVVAVPAALRLPDRQRTAAPAVVVTDA
jgi:EmrB/QacA subfamily drug resistance transporter